MLRNGTHIFPAIGLYCDKKIRERTVPGFFENSYRTVITENKRLEEENDCNM